MPREMTDHKGQPVEVNDHTVYHGYAYQFECPHCGVPKDELCVETTPDGPVEGEYRSPHQERAEVAREVFGEGVSG